jgi:hypothetical protein
MGWETLALAGAGGLASYFTGQQANKANLAANAANIEAAKAVPEEAQFEAPFSSKTQREGGGFDFKIDPRLGPSEAGAIGTSNIEAGQTNPLLAAMRQSTAADFKPSIGSLDDARGIVQRDNALQQGERDRRFNEGVSAINRRVGGAGFNAPAFATQSGKFLNEFSNANRLGGERQAIELMQGSAQNDYSNLLAAFQAQTAGQVGTKVPAFPGGESDPTVVASLANAPRQIADLGGAVSGTALSGLIQNIYNTQEADRARKSQEKLILALANR